MERHCDEPIGAPVELQADSELEPKTQSGWTQLGWALMVASVAVWIIFPVLPFLPLTGPQKVGAAGAVFVVAEILFWSGAAMAGPDAVRRMRGWWKQTDSSSQSPLTPAATLDDRYQRDS